MNINKLISIVPSSYKQEQKKEVVLLLIDLANIYLDIEEESK
ncbi:MAG: hypothetical protein ACNI28_09240 [Arcobacter sp.]